MGSPSAWEALGRRLAVRAVERSSQRSDGVDVHIGIDMTSRSLRQWLQACWD
jgi:hypothetical protein